MRAIFVIAALALASCGSLSQSSYDLDAGDANYDAVKAATQACEAQGGAIRLKGGYDGRQLSSYQCAHGKAR